MFLISESSNLNFEKNSEYEIYHNMIGIFEQLKKKENQAKSCRWQCS